MALPIFQGTIVRDNGDVVPNCEYAVVLESTGTDATIYSDRAGTTPLTAPYFADSDGFVQFYAAMADYRITATDSGTGFTRTWRYEPLFSPDSDFTTDAGTDMLVEQFNLRQSVANATAALGQTILTGTIGTSFELTEAQANAAVIVFNFTTTADITITTPNDNARSWLIINNDSGGNTVTFATNTGTGVVFSQQGEERQVRSDGTNMVNICRHALGETVAVPNGGIIPPTENYVILSDSTDDTASYNSGKVDNEQTTGSGATVVISFDIADTSSPFDNETWNCWNSEVRNPSAGATPGTLSNDEGQQITGTFSSSSSTGFIDSAVTDGVFNRVNGGAYANVIQGTANSGGDMGFDSADSTDSRQDSDRFHYKREQVTYYRRFK